MNDFMREIGRIARDERYLDYQAEHLDEMEAAGFDITRPYLVPVEGEFRWMWVNENEPTVVVSTWPATSPNHYNFPWAVTVHHDLRQATRPVGRSPWQDAYRRRHALVGSFGLHCVRMDSLPAGVPPRPTCPPAIIREALELYDANRSVDAEIYEDEWRTQMDYDAQ